MQMQLRYLTLKGVPNMFVQTLRLCCEFMNTKNQYDIEFIILKLDFCDKNNLQIN